MGCHLLLGVTRRLDTRTMWWTVPSSLATSAGNDGGAQQAMTGGWGLGCRRQPGESSRAKCDYGCTRANGRAARLQAGTDEQAPCPGAGGRCLASSPVPSLACHPSP